MELNEIIEILREAFNQTEIKQVVLDAIWYEKNISSGIDSTGFCYSASEVIYRLTGGNDKWKKMSISSTKWKDGGHCYLIDKKTGAILDITSDQYSRRNIEIPYGLAKPGGFRTKHFGKAAKKLAKMTGLIS
jgi:hypothetical protein